MRTPRTIAGLTLALALTLSACGSSDDDTPLSWIATSRSSTPTADRG